LGLIPDLKQLVAANVVVLREERESLSNVSL
jgi:hypothetical protein